MWMLGLGEWMIEWTYEWLNVWLNEGVTECMTKWMRLCMIELINGWMMNERVNEQVSL